MSTYFFIFAGCSFNIFRTNSDPHPEDPPGHHLPHPDTNLRPQEEVHTVMISTAAATVETMAVTRMDTVADTTSTVPPIVLPIVLLTVLLTVLPIATPRTVIMAPLTTTPTARDTLATAR